MFAFQKGGSEVGVFMERKWADIEVFTLSERGSGAKGLGWSYATKRRGTLLVPIAAEGLFS